MENACVKEFLQWVPMTMTMAMTNDEYDDDDE